MEYTRVTVIGARRQAELVLPDDQPVGVLLPEILDLLDEPTGGGRLVLSTLVGHRVDTTLSLDEQDVGHGAMLRLDAIDDAPQPPTVVDLTEAVSDAVEHSRHRWGAVHARSAVAVLGALIGAICSHALLAAYGTPGEVDGMLLACLTAGALVLLVGAGALARSERMAAALAAAAAAVGAALPVGAAVGVPVAGPVAGAVLFWLAVAAISGVGRRRRGALVGAAVGIALIAAAVGTIVSGADVSRVAAVVGVVAAVTVGFLPAVSLVVGGVATWDDKAIAGGVLPRSGVEPAIDQAFAALGWLVVAVSVPALVAALVLVDGPSPWGWGLAAAIVVVFALRSRLFPLGHQRLVLLAVAALPAARWLATTTLLEPPMVALIAGILLVAVVLGATARPSDVVRARLRRFSGVVELVAILTAVPLLLGALGVFEDLIGTFD